jgi:hypothetical protein
MLHIEDLAPGTNESVGIEVWLHDERAYVRCLHCRHCWCANPRRGRVLSRGWWCCQSCERPGFVVDPDRQFSKSGKSLTYVVPRVIAVKPNRTLAIS